MDDSKRHHKATLAAQALGWIDETTKAIVPPVYFTSTYIRDTDNQYRTGYSYGRPHNPTTEHPEALLAALEGGAACFTFASGMAAAIASLLAPSTNSTASPHSLAWVCSHLRRPQYMILGATT